MEDSISRAMMKDAIDSTTWYHQNRNKDMVKGASDEETAWYKAEDVYKAIENVPTAQSKRKKGRKKGKNICEQAKGHCEFKCSVCGAEIGVVEGGDLDGANRFNFCPACGAELKGEQE